MSGFLDRNISYDEMVRECEEAIKPENRIYIRSDGGMKTLGHELHFKGGMEMAWELVSDLVKLREAEFKRQELDRMEFLTWCKPPCD